MERADPLDPSDLLVTPAVGIDPRRILELAVAEGAQLRRFVPRRATLEEVFLDSLEEPLAEAQES